MRRYGYDGFQSTWRLITPSTATQTYRFRTVIPFTPEEFSKLCDNPYERFSPNPRDENWFLLRDEPKTPNTAAVLRFLTQSFVEKSDWTPHPKRDLKTGTTTEISTHVPSLNHVLGLRGIQDVTGDVLLQGQTETSRLRRVGRPLCDIELSSKDYATEGYRFYSVGPPTHKPPPICISRFQASAAAKRLQAEKGGRKKSGTLTIKNSDVPKRMAIVDRTPDQNTVMGLSAIEEYRECATQYKRVLDSRLMQMLLYSANIMHLSTLRAKDDRQEEVSEKIRKIANRDRSLRTEWLHMLPYGLHPMKLNPQDPKKLAAARACDNTRMMLIECALRWFALNVPSSENRLSAQFDLVLDTQVIDTITLVAMICVDGIQCKLTQTIDALRLNPTQISASDLAGLVGMITLLIQGHKPVSQETIKIAPSSRNFQTHTCFSRTSKMGENKSNILRSLNR